MFTGLVPVLNGSPETLVRVPLPLMVSAEMLSDPELVTYNTLFELSIAA
jgi:hypothetical protein